MIPEELKSLDQWIVWRNIDGKKPPIGNDGKPLQNWKSHKRGFARVDKEAQAWPGAGRGIVHENKVSGIDCDHCRNVETGEIDPRAMLVVEKAEAYAEVSPSKEGIKIFGNNDDGTWLELNFSSPLGVTAVRKPPGYFTVTGEAINELRADRDLTQVINMFYGFYGQGTAKPGGHKLPERIERGTQNDELFREGCKYRADGKSEDEIYGMLQAIKGRCDPIPTDKEIRLLAHSCSRYEQGKKDGFPLTESGDSEFFAARNADILRFDHRRGRWLLFDGARWRPQSNGEVDRLALEAMRVRQAASVGSKEQMRWAVGGESRGRRQNLLALAQTVVPLADSGDGWDTEPWLLGVANGVVDLRTGSLRPGRWDDRITMQTRFPYEEEARSELWESTVADIFKDDPEIADFVHKALGYSITGDCREEVYFMNKGDGRNGKGTIINTVAHVLGDYHDNLSFHSLERGQHGPKESTNDLAKLTRKRFVTASENAGGRLDESRVKNLTGRDPISARFLYKEEFTYIPEFKLWLSVNTPPKVRDDSEGFWARTRVIPFKQCYSGRADGTLKDRLLDEGVGVLAWLVRGCLRWRAEGLGAPPGVIVAVETYRAAEDLLSDFYDERCVVAEGVRCRPGELFDAYARWCDAVRARFRLGSKGFSQHVAKKFRRTSAQGAMYFLGIGVATDRLYSDNGNGQGEI